jgi:hypothetical protein
MTSVLKRFPKKTPAESHTPEEHALWVKHNDISERLELAARKSALISFAFTGVMELHQSDEIVSLRDAADRLEGELRGIANEIGEMTRLSLTVRLWLAHRLIDLVKLLVPEDELDRLRRLR